MRFSKMKILLLLGLPVLPALSYAYAKRESAPAQRRIVNDPPAFTSFTVTDLGDNFYTISGNVSDESPEGLLVSITGLDLDGLSIVTDSEGDFTSTVYTEESGTIEASVIDDNEQTTSTTTDLGTEA